MATILKDLANSGSVSYDRDGRFLAAYIQLSSSKVTMTEELIAGSVFVDYSGDALVGIELLESDLSVLKKASELLSQRISQC